MKLSERHTLCGAVGSDWSFKICFVVLCPGAGRRLCYSVAPTVVRRTHRISQSQSLAPFVLKVPELKKYQSTNTKVPELKNLRIIGKHLSGSTRNSLSVMYYRCHVMSVRSLETAILQRPVASSPAGDCSQRLYKHKHNTTTAEPQARRCDGLKLNGPVPYVW